MTKWLRTLNRGFFERSVDLGESIEQHIYLLFRTERGSVLSDPQYGIPLHSLLYNLPENQSSAEIETLITDAVLYADPRLKWHQLEIRVDIDRQLGAIDILLVILPDEERREVNVHLSRTSVRIASESVKGKQL